MLAQQLHELHCQRWERVGGAVRSRCGFRALQSRARQKKNASFGAAPDQLARSMMTI